MANTHQIMMEMLQFTAVITMVLLTLSDGGAIKGEITNCDLSRVIYNSVQHSLLVILLCYSLAQLLILYPLALSTLIHLIIYMQHPQNSAIHPLFLKRKYNAPYLRSSI